MPSRDETGEGPEVGFDESACIDEGERRFQQFSTDTAAAHAIIDDEPTQMRDVLAQILAVDRDRADDLAVPHGCPNGVARIVQSVAELRQTAGDDALEALSKS